ncbi:hypothetical protein Tco_0413377 [Tanacetum coccineum]
MEGSSKNLTRYSNSQMSTHDKNGLGFGIQMDDLSNKSDTDSENSLTVFEVRSSDEESTLANNKFTKASEYRAVPPPITGNPLTPRADISFAGLDEFAFRNKIIESKTTKTNKTVGTTNEATILKPKSVNETVVSKSKVNRDEVIIEDWTSDDEDDECADKTISSTNVDSAFRSKRIKVGNLEILLQDHAVVDNAIGIHNLSDAEIYAGLATLGYVTEGDFVPLLPAMLAGAAVDQGEGSAQPAEPHHTPVDPISSTSQPPIPSPPHQSPPHPSPQHQSPPHSPLHHSLYQSPPHSPHHSPP